MSLARQYNIEINIKQQFFTLSFYSKDLQFVQVLPADRSGDSMDLHEVRRKINFSQTIPQLGFYHFHL